MMAGDLGLGKSQWLDKTETTRLIQNVHQQELRGGVVYHDGQFDDARMARRAKCFAIKYILY